MGPLGYFIAILGCADSGASCQTVATLAPRYESASQCAAARDGALDANSDLDFPTLVAQCRPSKAKPTAASVPVRDATDSKVA
jgi:acyl-CoA synthetase (AMP-forming)/AMP-acid ligase II